MIRHFSTRSINRTVTLVALGLGLTALATPSAEAAVTLVSSDLTYSTSTKALITAVDPNVTVSDYYEAFGGTVISGDDNHYFGRLDGSSASRGINRGLVENIDAAVQNEVYGTFTIGIDAGMQLDLTSLKIGMQMDDGAANETFSVYLRNSLDPSASNIGEPVSLVGTGPGLTQGTGTFDLTGLPNLTTETRFYLLMVAHLPSGISTTTKYIRIMPDIVLEGDVSPVPEPGTLALVGLSGLLMLHRRRVSVGA